MFVKSDTSKKSENNDDLIVGEVDTSATLNSDTEQLIDTSSNGDFIDKFSLKSKRIIGILMAIFSGIMYGGSFSPVVYAGQQDNNNFYIDYLFSFYTGVMFTSVVYFVIYCVIKKNKPVLYTNLILPAFVSGWMWASMKKN